MAKRKSKSEPLKNGDGSTRHRKETSVLCPVCGKPQDEPLETPVEAWQFLVKRRHRWRMQLYIQGRNMTARQLVGWMKANQLDGEAVAKDYRLPVEAVREAVAYVEQNRELVEIEAEIERLMGKRGGKVRVAQPVS